MAEFTSEKFEFDGGDGFITLGWLEIEEFQGYHTIFQVCEVDGQKFSFPIASHKNFEEAKSAIPGWVEYYKE